MIGALKFKINEYIDADIYPVGSYYDIDWNSKEPCSLGDDYSAYHYKSGKETNLVDIAVGLDGDSVLRLKETKRYIVRVNNTGTKPIQLPSIQNEQNKSIRIEKDENSVVFQFINYLGRSRISFDNDSSRKDLSFEVVPDKMNYEDDYIELTEALAEKCSALLLDYSGSTSNVFTSSDTDYKTLLEQFIFLRQFCLSDNLQGLFEEIKRNPDRILTEENEFRPIGCGMPSKKVFSHPFKYARNWNRYASNSDGRSYYLPSEIVITHKRENLDTPANRFLKYAIEQFDSICGSLVEALDQNGAQKQTECRKEAKTIHRMINDILRDHFFDEVGTLDIMPQNNQVLQKREGYLQVFTAYSMIDLALQLNWSGEKEIYEGESKNVALLYEYWLFFELVSVIKSIDSCQKVQTNENPFASIDKGKLIISLKEGVESCQSFHIPNLKMRINLYYNKVFTPADFRMTRYEGSYSRPFRPDYTLAIFPECYSSGKRNGEADAIKHGHVSYVHFDAKYRITDLRAFVGKVSETADEEKLEIDDEKAEEIINTYKRGDLLKMHTYNNAIRRTVGSYVLYPGEGSVSGQRHVYSLYDEILPGVGAFAIKPSNSSLGESTLKDFISSIITEKAQISSRLNRINYYSEIVLREPEAPEIGKNAIAEAGNLVSQQLDNCYALGYMRADFADDYYNYLRDSGSLKNGSVFYFYYYAIKNGAVYTHHHDIMKVDKLRIFTNRINDTDTYQLEPIICSIETTELMSKADLVQKLKKEGYETDEKRHHADYYYVMRVKVISESGSTVSLKKEDVNSVNSNDSFSPHSPKVIPAELIENNKCS
jgi:predicted component of viral defense system (DUF524 family)